MVEENNLSPEAVIPFYEQSLVETDYIPVGEGVQLGLRREFHAGIGIGGAYGTWGKDYNNQALVPFVENHLGEPLDGLDRMNLSPLGFAHRHHVGHLSEKEQLDLEIKVGTRFLKEAAQACGWDPEEVEGVMIGMTGPIADDYTERIAAEAGIPENALKISIHKACDSSMGALHLVLNPDLPVYQRTQRNIAKEMLGKKVLVGGIEGLSRFVQRSRDKSAMQLFGNGAGVIGVIPGETMKFLVGEAREVYDDQGVLAVSMSYPHSGQPSQDQSLIEVSQAGKNHLRFAGMMHQPESGESVEMAGPMGMVKLFVRSGVDVVQQVYQKYQALMAEKGTMKEISVAIVHHANLKINNLKAKRLSDLGIRIPMPWLLSEFGNISAASNMVAFLRQLSQINPGDHILFDGFGAGTYYDTFAVALGEGS